MKRFYLGLVFVFLISEIAFSQINFSRDTTISVMENANGFKHAWVGGINAMQPSEIDLNLDGINDLILFDRTGNKLTPFLDINGEILYDFDSDFGQELRFNFIVGQIP